MEIQVLNMTVVWLVILVALVVIELLTMGLTTVWLLCCICRLCCRLSCFLWFRRCSCILQDRLR